MEEICYECAMEKAGRPVEGGIVTVNPGICSVCQESKMVTNPLKYGICILSEETKTRLKEKICAQR